MLLQLYAALSGALSSGPWVRAPSGERYCHLPKNPAPRQRVRARRSLTPPRASPATAQGNGRRRFGAAGIVVGATQTPDGLLSELLHVYSAREKRLDFSGFGFERVFLLI